MQFNIEEGQLLKTDEEVGCIDTLQLYLKKMQLLASGKAVSYTHLDVYKRQGKYCLNAGSSTISLYSSMLS